MAADNDIDDVAQYKAVRHAMKVIELSIEEQEEIFSLVASVLHLGNVGFGEEGGVAQVLKPESVQAVAKVSVKGHTLKRGLLNNLSYANI